ncbi:MAG: hypothetical protein HKN56_08010 [Gammaproteobacteria bacterium]|nr:hypothetical protein [Gammaproteobacteria bacterium]
MLDTIREKFLGALAIPILGIIALSLVVTFGNIDTGFSPAGTAVSVNGEDIPASEFRALYQQQRQQWETQFRQQLPADLARGMATSVIDSIARNRVISQHVAEQGYRTSDTDLVRAIQENTTFHVGGKFSQPSYEQLLAAQGFSPQRFEYEQRQSMQLQQFVEGVASSAFYTPAEFRRYIELDGEARSLEYVILPADKWVDQVKVSDEVVAERYAEQPDLYRTVESVSLNYVELDYNAMLEDVQVRDADVRDYYETNLDEFRGPDDRLISHILITVGDDEEAAVAEMQEVLNALAGGARFESLAAEYSDDTGTAAQGGSLGWLGVGDAPAQEFENAMFELLEPGDISDPVRTEFGYHLIRLDDLRPGDALSFAEVGSELQRRLQEDEAGDRYAELLDELDERALESLDGLAPVADAMQLELKTVDEFTRNGGGELGFNAALVDTVFSLEVLEDGENSPVISLEDGRAVVVQVTDYRPSTTRPLEDVADEIRAELVQEDAIAIGTVQAMERTERLNAGESAADVLADLDVELTAANNLRRGAVELPTDLAAELFRVPVRDGGPTDFRTQLLADGSTAIFRVTDVSPGQPDDFSLTARDERKEQLALRLGAGQATGLVETLIDSADVYVTPDFLENELGNN